MNFKQAGVRMNYLNAEALTFLTGIILTSMMVFGIALVIVEAVKWLYNLIHRLSK